MTKAEYREYFAECKPFIKFKYFLKKCNIPESSFSKFMQDDLFDYQISLNKLNQLYNLLNETIYGIIA
nr:MAG TPA: hypothetical protein [Inoviridae sp.]